MGAASKTVIADSNARAKTLDRPSYDLPLEPAARREALSIEVPFGLSKAEQEKIRLGQVTERVIEIVESVALEIGDDELIRKVELALRDRGLKGGRKRRNKPRRYTVYLDVETGNCLNATAKAEGKNRYYMIRDLIREQLGLPPLAGKVTDADREAAEE